MFSECEQSVNRVCSEFIDYIAHVVVIRSEYCDAGVGPYMKISKSCGACELVLAHHRVKSSEELLGELKIATKGIVPFSSLHV